MMQQRIYLRVRFPHPADKVFGYLADHEGLSRWLGVDRVELRHHTPRGGAGTVRRVFLTLPGGVSTHLDEVIERFEPPRRISYRGKPGLLLSRYEADLRFPGTLDGCYLEWTIRLATRLPGGAPALALLLHRTFREGLRRLEALLGPGPGVPRGGSICRAGGQVPGPGMLPEDEELYPRLLAAAQQANVEQARRALELCAGGPVADTRYWFFRALSLATSFLLDRVQSGCFQHPCWVLRLICAAHRYLERSIAVSETPGGEPEAHWQSWLRATEHASRWWSTPVQGAIHAIAKGSFLHVSEDFPRALAEVYTRHYLGLPGVSYDTFLDDWRAMAPAYDQVWTLIRPELQLLLTWKEQLEAALLPSREKELLSEDYLLGLPRERQQAWQRGQRLLTLVGVLRETG